MSQPTILIVDDDPLILALVQHKLAARGYSVATASDGGAGLECAKALQPNLIVIDLMMPVLDGRGLLRALRAEPTLINVPVVVLSARGGEEEIVEMLRLGATDFVVKPFSPEELTARIVRILPVQEAASQ